MASDVQTWLKATTLAAMARAMVEVHTIPRSTGASGTYQNPIKSKMLQACDALPKVGLAKGQHLMTLADVFESVRSLEYKTASSGLYEVGDKQLRRAIAQLIKHPDAFIKKATAEKAIAIFGTRYYGY
jgi:hypothetical protein